MNVEKIIRPILFLAAISLGLWAIYRLMIDRY